MNISIDPVSFAKRFTNLLLLISVLITACGNNYQNESASITSEGNASDSINIKNIPAKLMKLVRSYPGFLDSDG